MRSSYDFADSTGRTIDMTAVETAVGGVHLHQGMISWQQDIWPPGKPGYMQAIAQPFTVQRPP